MEYSLTDFVNLPAKLIASLNPCCNGILPDEKIMATRFESLNPCCNGILPDKKKIIGGLAVIGVS